MPVNIKWKEYNTNFALSSAFLGSVRVANIRRTLRGKLIAQITLPLPDGSGAGFDKIADAKAYCEAKILEFIALTGLTQEGAKRPLSDMEQMLDLIAGKKVSNG